jgi:hypothetical protein
MTVYIFNLKHLQLFWGGGIGGMKYLKQGFFKESAEEIHVS